MAEHRLNLTAKNNKDKISTYRHRVPVHVLIGLIPRPDSNMSNAGIPFWGI